jgi:hypothetical protein
MITELRTDAQALCSPNMNILGQGGARYLSIHAAVIGQLGRLTRFFDAWEPVHALVPGSRTLTRAPCNLRIPYPQSHGIPHHRAPGGNSCP